MVCVWKLKGLFAAGPGAEGGAIEPSLSAGLRTLAGEFIEEFIEPKCPGKVSVIGDREFGSKVIDECTVRSTPPIPSPPPSCCSSGIGVGGVGVRGGAGIGRLEAISAAYGARGIMRASAKVFLCCNGQEERIGA
jgi:hypothetical protein